MFVSNKKWTQRAHSCNCKSFSTVQFGHICQCVCICAYLCGGCLAVCWCGCDQRQCFAWFHICLFIGFVFFYFSLFFRFLVLGPFQPPSPILYSPLGNFFLFFKALKSIWVKRSSSTGHPAVFVVDICYCFWRLFIYLFWHFTEHGAKRSPFWHDWFCTITQDTIYHTIYVVVCIWGSNTNGASCASEFWVIAWDLPGPWIREELTNLSHFSPAGLLSIWPEFQINKWVAFDCRFISGL